MPCDRPTSIRFVNEATEKDRKIVRSSTLWKCSDGDGDGEIHGTVWLFAKRTLRTDQQIVGSRIHTCLDFVLNIWYYDRMGSASCLRTARLHPNIQLPAQHSPPCYGIAAAHLTERFSVRQGRPVAVNVRSSTTHTHRCSFLVVHRSPDPIHAIAAVEPNTSNQWEEEKNEIMIATKYIGFQPDLSAFDLIKRAQTNRLWTTFGLVSLKWSFEWSGWQFFGRSPS